MISAMSRRQAEQFLADLERREIDRQFAVMSSDEAYQTLSVRIADTFAESDWEALSIPAVNSCPFV